MSASAEVIAPLRVEGESAHTSIHLTGRALRRGGCMEVHQRLLVVIPEPYADHDTLLALRELLADHPGDLPVWLVLQLADATPAVIDISSRYRVEPSAGLRRQIGALLG